MATCRPRAPIFRRCCEAQRAMDRRRIEQSPSNCEPECLQSPAEGVGLFGERGFVLGGYGATGLGDMLFTSGKNCATGDRSADFDLGALDPSRATAFIARINECFSVASKCPQDVFMPSFRPDDSAGK